VKALRLIYAVTCIFTSLLLLNACSGGKNSGTGNGLASDPGTTASLSSIMVTPGAASIPAGSAQQFSAMGTYSDGSSKDITATVQWSSSNASIASVSSSGMANGAASGQTTVIAKSDTVQVKLQ
jgi:hypothetical protein